MLRSPEELCGGYQKSYLATTRRHEESFSGRQKLVDCLRINVDLAICQPYLDLEAGDNQSLKFQVARPGIEPRSSCSASQELNHSATTAPCGRRKRYIETAGRVLLIPPEEFRGSVKNS